MEFAKILKANPYHDEKGRFSTQEKAKFVSSGGVFSKRKLGEPKEDVFFHGTTQEVADSILKNGLLVGMGGGGDEWASKHGWATLKADIAGDTRKKSVYMAKERKSAEEYAGLASQLAKEKNLKFSPVIFEIRVPPSVRKQMIKDELDPSALRYTGKIKPSWIRLSVVKTETEDRVYLVVLASQKYQSKKSAFTY